MKSPFGKEMSLLQEERTIEFRKEEFKVKFHFYKCEDTGEQFTTAELDEINMNQVHNQYRDRFNLPFPDEIVKIKEMYNLPASKMAEILGFGVNSYRNYEAGEVPSNANGKLIQLASDPKKFRNLVELADSFDPAYKEKLLHRIDNLIRHKKENIFAFNLEEYFFYNKVKTDRLAGEYSGYKKPSLEKLTEMIVFFTEKMQPFKTQMNKLLFYADFLHFKRSCFSMSGTLYRAINMGPVVNNFNSIFEYIANNDQVDIFCTEFSNGQIGEQFKIHPGRNINTSLFTETEMAVLNDVVEKFKTTKTSDIIALSHKERAWLENEKDKKIISYKYAFDLSQI